NTVLVTVWQLPLGLFGTRQRAHQVADQDHTHYCNGHDVHVAPHPRSGGHHRSPCSSLGLLSAYLVDAGQNRKRAFLVTHIHRNYSEKRHSPVTPWRQLSPRPSEQLIRFQANPRRERIMEPLAQPLRSRSAPRRRVRPLQPRSGPPPPPATRRKGA